MIRRVRCRLALLSALLALTTFFSSSTAQQSPKGTKAPRPTTKKQGDSKQGSTPESEEPPDFSVLVPLKDGLLELKGALKADISREDYQKKLQAIEGEAAKVEDRLGKPKKPAEYVVYKRYICYTIVLARYGTAGAHWGMLNTFKRYPAFYSQTDVFDAEDKLKAEFEQLSQALTECATLPAKPTEAPPK